MTPTDIFSPEQLYQQAREELGKQEGVDLANLTSDQEWILAESAADVDLLEEAKAHYTVCANDPDFLRAGIARQRLEKIEELLRDQAALRKIRDIKMLISLKSFAKARGLLEGFEREHAEIGDVAKRRFVATQKTFEKKRNEYFQREARVWFPKYAKKLISQKVREKDIELSDVVAWTRRDLPQEAFARLTERFQKKDDVVKPEDAERFWEQRAKKGWSTASYGAGTFIARPPTIKKPKRRSGNRSRSGSSGPAPKIQIPKPPTRDSWWAKTKAKIKERESWVMAYFAENSGLFEVSEREKLSNCPICNGVGLESKTLQNGSILSYICTRCAGAQRDVRIQYR